MAVDLEVEGEDSVTRQALTSRPALRNAAATAVFSQSVTREVRPEVCLSTHAEQFDADGESVPRRVRASRHSTSVQLSPEPDTRRGAVSSVVAVSDLYTT